jgi:hypothetical protein
LQNAPASAPTLPTGAIILWSGSLGAIPTGYALCDGSNSTPDLRDRFVIAAGSTYAVGATGGSANAIVVSHTHTATSTVTDPGHIHTISPANVVSYVGTGANSAGVSNADDRFPTSMSTATTGITVATTNASAGTSGTGANLPPYYALAYIMKT